jgi:outer membrane protein OmpA-like peptidoglycan-associated protein
MQIAIEKRLPSVAAAPPTISQENRNSLSGSLIQQYDFDVFPLHPGSRIPFPGIVFEPNTSRISPLSEPEINRLVRFLKEHPDMVIEIGLYSYGELSHTLALDLCAKRAEVLINFITSRGISPDRLIKGEYGKKEIVDYKYSWRNNIVIVKTME